MAPCFGAQDCILLNIGAIFCVKCVLIVICPALRYRRTSFGHRFLFFMPTANGNSEPLRSWVAKLALRLAVRAERTVLVDNTHLGPLRVQRPFYPENALCHLYLLHPPGGLVLGDALTIDVALEPASQALLTTPSAGKVYGVQGHKPLQQQAVTLTVAEGAVVEWLPQETIVFNGANAQLKTHLKLEDDARACVWDIVCLGRPASNDAFEEGRCEQVLQVWRDDRLLLLEKNRLSGGTDLLAAKWGLGGANSFGTVLATVRPEQRIVDTLRRELEELAAPPDHLWGVTQKDELFVVRYMGSSARLCREGFTLVWKRLRPLLNEREAVIPRIWLT